MNSPSRKQAIKAYLSGNIVRVLVWLILDILCVLASEVLALLLRFDLRFSAVPAAFWKSLSDYWYIGVVTTVIIFFIFKMYRNLWSMAGAREFLDVLMACIVSGGVNIIGMGLMNLYLPRSYPIIYVAVLIFLTSFTRYSYRLFGSLFVASMERRKKPEKKVMLIGAGSAGVLFLREAKNSKFANHNVKCFIDDSDAKQGTFIDGIPIVGKTENIPYFVEKYGIEEIIVAIPSIDEKRKKEILQICSKTSCAVNLVPGLYQIMNKEVSITKLREVEIPDLLGRPPVNLELESVMSYVKDKTVLITGGGGSIGSELCRQIAGYKPKHLVIVDIYENNAYDIQMELMRHFPDLKLTVLIASVRNRVRIEKIFQEYRPDIVYHAAAHKHVPLMEDSPNEAVKNNVCGTYNMATIADKYGVFKFVLISTDKAVRPTNIMGASKRICEMIVQGISKHSKTEFVAVRFGNVLGSNGSVIPLFKQQIKEGGPVTVTHPDVIRYFMTIPEAVSLVLQAGAMAKGGEIFILDMGEPVRIADLAINLINLSGYKAGVDIMIEYTGLRPGEKLYEELLINEDNLVETLNDKIFVGCRIPVEWSELQEKISVLERLAYDECQNMKELIREIVPEYTITSN